MKPFPPPALVIAFLAVVLAGCISHPPPSPPPLEPVLTPSPTLQALPLSPSPAETPSLTPVPPEVRFAVIGDYGLGSLAEEQVAALIQGWQPDLLLTVGDNNYPSGAAEVIDENIGQFYHEYIYPYSGVFGAGALENRFFPSLGNHDWYTEDAWPYLDYFTLPGNERYYDFTWGPVHFFALDSDEHEPDGVNRASVQAAWLEQGLAGSTSPWQVVYFHHPPYSSGDHGSTDWMRWPFAAWGADMVLSGHDHTYERLLVDGIPYIVNGLGGAGIYDFNDPLPETRFRYNAGNGAMLVTATGTELTLEFFSQAGSLVDSYRVAKP